MQHIMSVLAGLTLGLLFGLVVQQSSFRARMDTEVQLIQTKLDKCFPDKTLKTEN